MSSEPFPGTTDPNDADTDDVSNSPPINPEVALQAKVDEVLTSLDIREQVYGVQDSTLILTRNSLQLLRRFTHRVLYNGRTLGPYNEFLTDKQRSRLPKLMDLMLENLSESETNWKELSVGSGQILQLLTDAISSAVADRRVMAVDREFLVQLADEVAVLYSSRLAGEVARLQSARINLEESAGAASQSELAREFAAYARTENRRGYAWLVGTITLVAASVWLALRLLDLTDALSWQSLIGHLLIALPCLGLSAYCARESSRHRESARWSSRLAVQLKSISAFTDRLSDPAREALLGGFGQYVFGPHVKNEDNQLQSVPPEFWTAVNSVLKSRSPAP